MTKFLEIDGHEIHRPNMCGECANHLVHSPTANALAFCCPSCKTGGFVNLRIGTWALVAPVSQKAFVDVLNGKMAADGLIDTAGFN